MGICVVIFPLSSFRIEQGLTYFNSFKNDNHPHVLLYMKYYLLSSSHTVLIIHQICTGKHSVSCSLVINSSVNRKFMLMTWLWVALEIWDLLLRPVPLWSSEQLNFLLYDLFCSCPISVTSYFHPLWNFRDTLQAVARL